MLTQRDVFGGGVAVVTGAGSGIGAGLARHLVNHCDMTVVCADIDARAAERVAADLYQQGGRAVAHTVDVRDADAMEDLATGVYDEHGPVRLLINNAGVEQFGYLWDVPVDNWRQIIDVNISGVFNGIRAFLPRMITDVGRSHVLTVASVGAVTSMPLQAPYIMSKHAVLGMVECLYQEVAQVGADVAVGAVLPGVVASNIFESAGGVRSGDVGAAEDHRVAMRALRAKAISPEEAAETIMEQAAREEFYIVTHPDAVLGAMDARAERLATRRPPGEHRSRFDANTGA